MNLFTELERIERAYRKTIIPATEIDHECRTAMYEARLEDAEKYLRENPEELLDVDIDAMVAIYKKHNCDMCDLGETIHRYMTGLIQEQAKESVDVELNV